MVKKIVEKIKEVKKREEEEEIKEAKLKILFELLGEYYYEEVNINVLLDEVDNITVEDDTRLPPIA